MSKPHEETWTVDPLTYGCVHKDDGRMVLQPLGERSEESYARGQLAAQAPAVARLLSLISSMASTDPGVREMASELLHAAGVLP